MIRNVVVGMVILALVIVAVIMVIGLGGPETGAGPGVESTSAPPIE